MVNSQTMGHDHMCPHKKICWTAIIAGALVGIGLSFLLNLFNVAIGLSVFTTNPEGMMTLAVGGFVGLLIGTIVAMFLAGFTSGYLSRSYSYKRNLGILYGFTTWALALIITVLLAAHLGRYVVAYSNFVANPTMVKVSMSENENAPTVAKTDRNTMTVNAEKATNTAGGTALIIFVLFFVGAITCCFGAHCGLMCCDAEDCNVPPKAMR